MNQPTEPMDRLGLMAWIEAADKDRKMIAEYQRRGQTHVAVPIANHLAFLDEFERLADENCRAVHAAIAMPGKPAPARRDWMLWAWATSTALWLAASLALTLPILWRALS